jgi:hypothetical protein
MAGASVKGIRWAGLLAATAALAAAVATVPMAFALAGYQTGPYSGQTEQDEEIRFRAG